MLRTNVSTPTRHSCTQGSTYRYAMTPMRRAAEAALLPSASVEFGATGGGTDPTNDRWHHVVIAPCMQ
jgi:hypothetical protein